MHKSRFGVILLVLVFVVCLAQAASAKNVAYILEDSSTPSGNIINSITSAGLTYDIIRDSQIPAANFSQYSILVIGEDVGNINSIPYTTKSTIFFTENTAEKIFGGTTSGITTSNAKQIKVVYATHPVFANISIPVDGVVNIYSGAGQPMHFLRIKPSYVTSLAIKTSENQPVIAYYETTSDGKRVRRLFFGAVNQDAWLATASKIFENALKWEMEEIDQDKDGYILANDCNDNDPLIHPGATEVPYDGIDQDCNGYDKLDVDGDGFCAAGKLIQNSAVQCILDSGKIIGTDCNDNDASINLNNPNVALNCKNDAPVIINIPQNLVFNEDQIVEFQVVATDPEGDELTYSINDSAFDVEGNTFTLQPSFDNDGIHAYEITVSDGEFNTKGTMTITIFDVNEPPVSEEIPEQTWNEDEIYSINLNDYFHDGSVLAFGIDDSSALSHVHVSVDSSGIATFTPDADFAGTEHVSFYADDGLSRTASNLVTLTVVGVNDAPVFDGTIENYIWNEDTTLEDAFILGDYFTDIDSELNYEVVGNSDIDVIIVDGLVSFVPAHDYYGSEQVQIMASDGEYSAISNTFTLTVTEQGEPPVLSDLNCTTDIMEDEEYSCILDANDVEGDELTFSAENETDMICEIENNVLTYRPVQDYNGEASCDIIVSDKDGSDKKTLAVVVSAINDAPEITSVDPEISTVGIIEGRTKEFNVEVEDVDSEPVFSWTLDGVPVGNDGLSYTFPESGAGMHTLVFTATDEEFSVNQTWTIMVGPLSEFTCAEAGGNTCSNDQVCDGELLGVKDSNSCCSTACIPNFKDADACEVNDNNIRIDITDNSDEDIMIGDTENVEFRVYNDGDEEQKFDVTAYLYNLDKNRVITETEGSSEIREGGSRTFRLDLEIPSDLDLTHHYAYFVKAEDDTCGQAYLPIEIKRPDEKIEITDIDIPESAVCGQMVQGKVRTENLGSHYKDIKLTVASSKLGLDKDFSFRLTKYDSEDAEEKSGFDFVVPEVDSGTYKVKATIQYGNNKRSSMEKEIQIQCLDENAVDRENPEEGSETLSSNRVLLNAASGNAIAEKKEKYAPILMLLTFNILLAGMILVLYAVRKSRERL